MKLLLISSSGRVNSNSECLGKKVLKNLQFDEINLLNYSVDDVLDKREHKIWQKTSDDYYKIIDLFVKADLVVLSSPIYWYNVSSRLSRFIERISETLHTDPDFKAKISHKKVVLVIIGGDAPLDKGKVIIQRFRYICEFLNLDLVATVIGCANRSLEVISDENAMLTAQNVNQKILEMLDN